MSTSDFFQAFDPESPENHDFVRYARQLAGIDEQNIENVVQAFAEFVRVPRAEKPQVVAGLAAALRRSHALTAYLLLALEEFIKFFAENTPGEEEPTALAADLGAAGIIAAADEATTAALLARIAALSPSLFVYVEAAHITRGYHPFLDRVGTTVELRGVFTTPQGIEPTMHVGIASVFLEFDTGKQVFFQLDRAGLETLVADFKLAIERLHRLEANAAKLLNSSSSDVSSKIA
jgi:hypothetical protein